MIIFRAKRIIMISDLNIMIPQSDDLPFIDLFLIQEFIEPVVRLRINDDKLFL